VERSEVDQGSVSENADEEKKGAIKTSTEQIEGATMPRVSPVQTYLLLPQLRSGGGPRSALRRVGRGEGDTGRSLPRLTSFFVVLLVVFRFVSPPATSFASYVVSCCCQYLQMISG